MFRRNRETSNSNNNNDQLDLKLNLTPPTRPVGVPPAPDGGTRHRRSTSSSQEESPPRSCVSFEDSLKYSSSPETTSMVLVGCPRCLMYAMLSEADPRCPNCKSTVLLDFQNINNYNDNNNIDDNNNNNFSIFRN